MATEVVIARRFRGPPESGNGGYAAGTVAAGVEGAATATLRIPPPLDSPLILDSDGVSSTLVEGDTLVAEAEAAELDLVVPAPPSLEEAAAAAERFAGDLEHIFPGCFVCGPERAAGDGLRIFPGPVAGSELVAAPWVPDPSLGPESDPLDRVYVWSALDCPSYFALAGAPLAVLGRLTARIDRLPNVGDSLVAFGWPMGVDGRKHFSGSALATAGGDVLTRAAATWIELKR